MDEDASAPLVIDATPAGFQLDPGHAAIIVIDMQNEFVSPGGMFDRAGIDIDPVRAVVPNIRAVLERARAVGLPVVYLKMQHRRDMADIGPPGSPHRQKHAFFRVGETVAAPDGTPNRILIAGDWGTEIIDELAPEAGDLVVAKHRYSGFFNTELDSVLRGLGVRQLVVTGCTTSVCVEATIRDAMYRDYACCLLSDCCAEPIGMTNARTNHEASLLTIQLLYGWVSDSGRFLEKMSLG